MLNWNQSAFYTNSLRYLYTAAYYLAIPVILLRMVYRAARYNSAYRERWRERFGFIHALSNPETIWVHAVSLGETLAAVPLVKALLVQYPTCQVIMTSTTPTGAAQVIKQFGDRVIGVYSPYDLPGSVRRFFKRANPRLGIIMETELWPNLLAECVRLNIPLMLANARLSARSFRGYRKIAPLTQQMLNSFTLVAAQAPGDAERFLALGLDKSRLQITGNIKFDIQLPADLAERGRALRTVWGNERLVWVAASTHEGEESILMEACRQVRSALPQALLVLVPRHPERFGKVAQICRQAGFATALRSHYEPVKRDTTIVLGDTMGELMLFYAASDVAFVGGSLVPVGGHNLIEPAILGLPVLTGPQLHNFVDISQLLLQAGGAQITETARQIAASVIELLRDPAKRQAMGEKARAAVLTNTGALAKHLQWVDSELN